MLLPPINFIFKLLQQHSIVQIWLYEQVCLNRSAGGLFLLQEVPRLGPKIRFQMEGVVLIDTLSLQLAIRIEGKIRGFDEFMNLVVDDAVEVKQVTKTNDKEERKNLGAQLLSALDTVDSIDANPARRPDPFERRQRFSDPELVRLRRLGGTTKYECRGKTQSSEAIPDGLGLWSWN